MSQIQSLQASLDQLNDINSKNKRDAIETLIKIFRNIHKDPNNKKYRKINLSNRIFNEQVWSFSGAQEFLLLTGWQSDGSALTFDGDTSHLPDVINLLLTNRTIAPSTSEWVEETKYERINQEQLREEQLQRKAAEEREKALKEYFKEKQYRKELNETIKADIRSDIERRQLIKPRFQTSQSQNNSDAECRPTDPSTRSNDDNDDVFGAQIHTLKRSAGG